MGQLHIVCTLRPADVPPCLSRQADRRPVIVGGHPVGSMSGIMWVSCMYICRERKPTLHTDRQTESEGRKIIKNIKNEYHLSVCVPESISLCGCVCVCFRERLYVFVSLCEGVCVLTPCRNSSSHYTKSLPAESSDANHPTQPPAPLTAPYTTLQNPSPPYTTLNRTSPCVRVCVCVCVCTRVCVSVCRCTFC